MLCYAMREKKGYTKVVPAVSTSDEVLDSVALDDEDRFKTRIIIG